MSFTRSKVPAENFMFEPGDRVTYWRFNSNLNIVKSGRLNFVLLFLLCYQQQRSALAQYFQSKYSRAVMCIVSPAKNNTFCVAQSIRMTGLRCLRKFNYFDWYGPDDFDDFESPSLCSKFLVYNNKTSAIGFIAGQLDEITDHDPHILTP
jgi:hypothetical protein